MFVSGGVIGDREYQSVINQSCGHAFAATSGLVHSSGICMSDPGSLLGFCLFSILTGGADYEGMSKYERTAR